MRGLAKTLLGLVAACWIAAAFAGWDVVVAVVGSIFGLGVLIAVWVSAHLLIDQRKQRNAPEVVSWPRVAELEHATGVFDTFTKMDWPGHDAGVGDACRACAREKAAAGGGGYAALYGLVEGLEQFGLIGDTTSQERENEEATARVWAQDAAHREALRTAERAAYSGSGVVKPLSRSLANRTVERSVPGERLLSLRTTERGGWAINDACVRCGREATVFVSVRPEPGDVLAFTCGDCLTYNKVKYER